MDELAAECLKQSAIASGRDSLPYARALTTIAQYKALIPAERAEAATLNGEALSTFARLDIRDCFVLSAKATRNALEAGANKKPNSQ